MPTRPDIQTSMEGVGDGANPNGKLEVTQKEVMERIAAAMGLGAEKSEVRNEFLSGREVDPVAVYIDLAHGWLGLAEETCLAITPYEYTPVLKELLRRAGASEKTLHLQERLGEIEGEFRLTVDECRKQIADAMANDPSLSLSDPEAINKIVDQSTKIKALVGKGERLQRRVMGDPEKKVKGLKQLLEKDVEELDERDEWKKIYWQVRGSITLLDVHLQRDKALSDVGTYFEKLFLSSFYRQELGVREFLAVMEDPEFGKGIDEALKAIVDLHLGDGKKVKFGQYGPEFDAALEEYLKSEGKTFDRNDKTEWHALPKALQIENNYELPARDITDAYLAARASRAWGKDKPRDFVGQRCATLAKRIAEYTMLSTWLSVPRDAEGVAIMDEDGKPPKIGCGRLEGIGSNDLPKQLLAKWKYMGERQKNKPAGPPTFDWSKLPFEGFSRDMVHENVEAKINWVDNKDHPVKNVSKAFGEEDISIFELWYGKKYGEHALAEVFQGIALSGRAGLEEITVQEGEKQVNVLAKMAGGRTSGMGDNWFDSNRFVEFKQSLVREMALNNDREGKDDCLQALVKNESLREMGKHISTAISDPLLRSWFKVCLLASRLVSWVEKPESKGENPFTYNDATKKGTQALYSGASTAYTDMAIACAKDSGFLDSTEEKVLKQLTDKNIGTISFDDFLQRLSTVSGSSSRDIMKSLVLETIHVVGEIGGNKQLAGRIREIYLRL